MVRREDTVVAPMPSFDKQGGRTGQSSWDRVGRVDTVEQTNPNARAVPEAPSRQRVPAGQQPQPKVPYVQTPAYPYAPPQPQATQPQQRSPGSAPHEQPQAQAQAQAQGKILVLFACRGGAGATTLAVNVAATLARRGKKVCIVDLDLQLGDVFVALDLEPNTSLAALAREADTIDAAAFRRRLQHHHSGVFALTQVGRIDDVDDTLAERMPTLLATLSSHFDVVVVDGVRDFGDHSLAALDMADRIALVLTQDVPAVRRASRVCAIFRKLGYSDRKIQIVLNRQVQKNTVSEPEIERALGLPIGARVRNDYARMRAALDEGALLHDVARGSGVERDVYSLALTLHGEPTETVRLPESRGLFSRLFGRGK